MHSPRVRLLKRRDYPLSPIWEGTVRVAGLAMGESAERGATQEVVLQKGRANWQGLLPLLLSTFFFSREWPTPPSRSLRATAQALHLPLPPLAWIGSTPCSKGRHRRIAEATSARGGRRGDKEGNTDFNSSGCRRRRDKRLFAFEQVSQNFSLPKRTRNIRNSSVENAGSSTLKTASPAGDGCRTGGADISTGRGKRRKEN